MARTRIKRLYYRNGQIHTETRELGGEIHTLSRIWHYNGQLAEERRYYHGLLHGQCPQWNQRGRLLGAFKMVHGTGTQRYWHQNSQLRTEIDCTNGRFHGRVRLWLRDGTLIEESFYIQGKDVSRAAYLKAAREHLDWPQYADQPPGRVAHDNVALERKEQALFAQSILESSHAEARRWLIVGQHLNRRSLAKFRTQVAALRFVQNLYAAGAQSVVVAPIYGGKKGKLFADWILIQLPSGHAKRRAVRRMCQDFCKQRGGAVLPEKDIRENHLFLGLA